MAVALLTYTLRRMPLANLTEQVRAAQPAWVALLVGVLTVQTVLRAFRWRMLLLSLGYRPTTYRALTAMLAGTASGLILPGSGELLRCTILNRTDAIPLPPGLGTIVAERFVDLLFTGLLLALTFLVQTNRLLESVHRYVTLPDSLRRATGIELLTFGAAGLLAGLTGGWLLYVLWQRLPERYQFRDKWVGLRRGLASAWHVPNVPLYLAINVLIHSLSVVCILILFRALPVSQNLPPAAALTVVAVASLGSITIPTQASLGSYHFLVSRALLAYGLSLVNSTVWATFSHAVITLANIVLSLVGFLLSLRWLNRKRVKPYSESNILS